MTDGHPESGNRERPYRGAHQLAEVSMNVVRELGRKENMLRSDPKL
jgi:hypothetical protein